MAELINKFDCHICLHYFTNPKIIDCFHSFCKSCLEDYVRKYLPSGEFPCPLCSKSIRVPFGGVDKFPCNLYTEDDTETSSFSSCQQHKKERDLYCSLCNVAICTKCLTSSHQGHLLRNVDDIEEETREELEFVHANLKERLAELKTFRSNIKKEKKKLRPSLEADINKVNKQKEQINQHVENEGMKIKSELEESCKKRELSLSQLKRDADEAIKKLEILAKETPSVWSNVRLEEMMTMIPDVQVKMAQVKRLKLPEDALRLVFKEGEIQKRSLSGMLGQLQNSNSTGSNTQANSTSVIGAKSKKETPTKAQGDQEKYSHSSYAKTKNTRRDRFEHTFDTKNTQDITQASQLYIVKGVSWFLKASFQNKHNQPKTNLPSTITLCLFDAQDSTYEATFILKVINRLDESLSLKIKASFSFSSWYPYFRWKLAKDYLYPWTNDIEYLNSKDQLVVEAQITSLVKITGHDDFPADLASNCLDDYHMFSVDDDDEDGDGVDYDTSDSRAEDSLWYEEDGAYNDEYSDESDFDIHYSSDDEQDMDNLQGGAGVDASGDLKSIDDPGTDDTIRGIIGSNNAVGGYKRDSDYNHNCKNINKNVGDHKVCGAEDIEGVSADHKRNSDRDDVVHKRVRVGDHYKGSGVQKRVRTYDQP